ncbi:putative ADP-ribosylation factor GTPase-activating protein AGD14 [Acorus gramineus]|uniref:ADP-ribosylation factor GTPase-activating protein AGD14 n=1 Tax=Acorus gramineus TaxID=55184 RepID=A0AAV9BWS4_ACOGR|nr:putative ADP-ribosylation factor GTPase-activating protein AGD14 [Acorus gramineus]
MSSRKEEEKNEKIIRGLMKLPPNRRCINCNSLGPQYVCTNFWTFICTTCSGIHREFTHRVKSVSMAKFNSQEVEALQRGGNQRAREFFLKDWDMQRMRLPNNINVDKIREFIKMVYVDKKYAGGRTSDKPPRDMQSNTTHEEDHRRASSYHSYSQSPPYEHQYEDRRYGKPTSMLTRKPGSDRGLEGKISSFVYSPGCARDQMYEDRFANENSARMSDNSVSSPGDSFRSPNSQRERAASSSSFGSLDSNSVSLQSLNSGSQDLFGPQFVQSPATSSIPSVDLFVDVSNQPSSAISLEQKSSAASSSENQGWATFDLPHHVAPASELNSVFSFSSVAIPNPAMDDSMQGSSLQKLTAQVPVTSVSNEWNLDKHVVQSSTAPDGFQPWNAFDDFIASFPQTSFENVPQKMEPQVQVNNPLTGDPHSRSVAREGFGKDGIQRSIADVKAPVSSLLIDNKVMGSSFPPPVIPSAGGMQSCNLERRSTNPFDLPDASDLEPHNALDMSSLQATLPNSEFPSTFLGGFTQPWPPQNSSASHLPAVPQGWHVIYHAQLFFFFFILLI